MDRDRRDVARVGHAVDVARRSEPADVADSIDVAADEVQVRVEQLFVLDTLKYPERAPGDMVVDPGVLPRAPDDGQDRELSAGVDVQGVVGVPLGGAESLRGGQAVDVRQRHRELISDELSGRVPVQAVRDDGPDAVDQLGQAQVSSCGRAAGGAGRWTWLLTPV